MEAIVTITAAAAAVTKLVDFVRNLFGDKQANVPKWAWNAAAFGIAILGAFMFNIAPVDLPKSLRFEVTGGALQLATGLAIGGLSSGFHELFDLWSSKAKGVGGNPTP